MNYLNILAHDDIFIHKLSTGLFELCMHVTTENVLQKYQKHQTTPLPPSHCITPEQHTNISAKC